MPRSPLSFALTLVCLLGGASRLAAQNCGGPDEVFAQCPATFGFSASDVSALALCADDFTLAAPTSVTGIRWWGSYADGAGTSYCGPQADAFTVQLWGDTGGSGPDGSNLVADLTALGVTRSAAPVMQISVSGNNFPVFEYEVDLSGSPVALAAGTVYWLQVSADLSAVPNCAWVWILDPSPSNGFWCYSPHWPSLPPWHPAASPTLTPGFDFSFALLEQGSAAVNYCTPGTSAAGCQATLSVTGTPSASATSGFAVIASDVEGQKDGVFFQGTNGGQANPWGNGTSFQCVTPPVNRLGLQPGNGTVGLCDGTKSRDLNALWNAKPAKNPGSGTVVQVQLWYRDPQNTSNQTTSLSDAIEFTVGL